MLWASHQEFPNAQCTMVMRSIGLNCYENSKFTNQLYFPAFVDEFHAALPEARDQLLREMHRTNYSGLNPALLDVLYRQMYLDKLTGADRLKMITMSEIAAARMADNEVVLTLLDRKNGASEELRCDLVLLGTGFDREMPKAVRDLAALGVDGRGLGEPQLPDEPAGRTCGPAATCRASTRPPTASPTRC